MMRATTRFFRSIVNHLQPSPPLPPLGRIGMLLILPILGVPTTAAAQTPGSSGGVPTPVCNSSSHSCSVTITGNFSAPGSAFVTQASNTANPFTLTGSSSAQFITSLNGGTSTLDINNAGGTASSSANQAGGITFTHAGSITQTTSGTTGNVYGLLVRAHGSNGVTVDNGDDAVAGGASNFITLTNTGPLDIRGAFGAFGASALQVENRGGNGGSVTNSGNDGDGVPQFDGGRGGSGGSAGGISINNSASITAGIPGQSLSGVTDFFAINAVSTGGDGGAGVSGAAGGNSGGAEVTSSAPVSVVWTWTTSSGSPRGIYGIFAQSRGGDGGISTSSGTPGGAGGDVAIGAGVTLNAGGDVSVTTTNAGPAGGAAIRVLSQTGNGGGGPDRTHAGNGGGYLQYYNAELDQVQPLAYVTVNNARVTGSGPQVGGILAEAIGGTGGNGSNNETHGDGGAGGGGGAADNTELGTVVTITNGTVTTNGSSAPAIVARVLGGHGGQGANYNVAFSIGTNGGNGGNGGSTMAGNLGVTGNSTISTTGASSPGIVVITQGGNGGVGGEFSGAVGSAGNGGVGGGAGEINITIGAGSAVSTTGGAATDGSNPSYGIYASSRGGVGGVGGVQHTVGGGDPGDGGDGGGAGTVRVTVETGASVTTTGSHAIGIVAQSVSGAGAPNGEVSLGGVVPLGVVAGDGGAARNAHVTVNGGVATSGDNAHGVLALSASGAGGTTSNVNGLFYGSGADAGSAGTVGGVTIDNTGSITTRGANAIGALAQAIGGGGGSVGPTTGIVALGGDGGVAANGGSGTINTSGTIATLGDNALGALLQSIGGGGGNGGDSSAVIGAIGGSGEGGGNGGTIQANLTGGLISTQGTLAHGLVLQSIGGGGGNGGDATSTGTGFALAIGGSGDAGGVGGSTTVTGSAGSISTAGTKSAGLVAQSIGGGGGSGGAGYATSAGRLMDAAVAIGGTGKSGGNGGAVSIDLTNVTIATGQTPALTNPTTPTNLLPVDTFGIVAQSIGGGGGDGGSASAVAVSAATPVTPTGTQFSGSVAVGIGGSAETAGAGMQSAVTLNNGASVLTAGQGGHGVLVQSVGGGGGNGGDASALSATLAYGRAATAATVDVWSLTLDFTLGGKAGAGGSGGPASATINNGGAVTTYGDFANAVLVQSIGGGGGNGGFGASNTAGLGSTRSLDVTVALGATGGTGGTAGTAAATLAAGGRIDTFGSGALGLAVQSIGGGGGASQGGSFNIGEGGTLGDFPFLSPSFSGGVNIGLGGARGGLGNQVTVTNQGTIVTRGGDATGILAQSIGGGGGLGGSAGNDASADNPVAIVSGVRTFLTNGAILNLPVPLGLTATVGGKGGAGGAGGTVVVNSPGSIMTLGDWAGGVLAQSVGGGGGKGGTAAASGTRPDLTVTLTAGGANGSGGGGGAVTLGFGSGGTIQTGSGTTGYAAFGAVAQSIGGGGGMVADGSDVSSPTISVGGGQVGTSGDSANGSVVTVTGTGRITTLGYGAHAGVFQSIGGGGGIGGAGSSQSASAGQSGAGTLRVGGNGAIGAGGTVNVNNAVLTLNTAGANAFGILAQSIGGGGGLGFGPEGGAMNVTIPGTKASSASSSNVKGGSVTVGLASGSSIATAGSFAHGIVAQSIGGGGGIAAYPPTGGTQALQTFYNQTLPASAGDGGTVGVTVNGAIQTTGPAAFGILAQSIGNGGGVAYTLGNVYATGLGVGGGNANAVTVTQTGSIITTGASSTGIFAQSVAKQSISGLTVSQGGTVSVTVNGTVIGGSGSAGSAGVWVADGSASNRLTINGAGSVSAASGLAILYSGTQNLDVTNNGTVTGSYQLGTGGVFTNNGTWNASGTSSAERVENNTLLRVGPSGSFGQATITGALTQSASGVLAVDADFTGRRAGALTVTGDATLAGKVRPQISAILPGVALPFLTVSGTATGALTGESSSVFGYDVTRTGNTFSVAATSADFTPTSLLGPHGSVGGHIQAAWDAGGNAELAPLFALLGNLADQGPAVYAAALRQIAPDTTFAPGARAASGAQGFANATLSCPRFEGTTAMLVEGDCAWLRVTGRRTSQDSGGGAARFQLDSTVWQIGGQKEIGQGWFLGGSLAYETSWLSTPDKSSTGKGQGGHGGVAVKYQTGPWLFAASAFAGAGSFSTSRVITLPGFGSVAKGDPDTMQAGLLLRAAYTIGRESFYLRPSLSLTTAYVHSGSYRENGAGTLNLAVDSASQTSVIVNPMLEIGGRVALDQDMVLRPFLAVGLDLNSASSWTQTARLISAPAGSGSFTTRVPIDRVMGRVTAGAQLYTGRDVDLRLQYDGAYGGTVISHGGSVVISARF